MKINGFQKLTLLDYPGHVACTVFLAGCNWRCPFCHNSELISPDAPGVMDEEELLNFLKKRAGILEGIAFTGGEPLLREDLPELLRQIRGLGYPVKLDTNGSLPDRLEALLREGLVSMVAMDIKNSPERYGQTVGLNAVNLDAVRRSIRLLTEGTADYEFRTTVMRELHDESAMHGIGRLIRGAKCHVLQPFADRDSVLYAGFTPPDAATLEQWRGILSQYVGSARIRGM